MMILLPDFWVSIYLIQLLVISLALGSWTLHQPRLLMVSRISRFLIGFCSTPFILGGWMLLLVMIFPGSPYWLFLIPLPVLAIIQLSSHGRRTFYRLIRDYQRIRKLCKTRWPIYLIYACVALILVLVVHRLALNSQSPTTGHDALVYLSEALSFSKERSISAIGGAQGLPDGTIRGDSHNFLFPAFLSHALMTTETDPMGYPYDQAARVAFQVTFVYMLLSVVVLAGTARYLGVAALSLILLLIVPHFEYISYQSSRDAFRIIPLLLLTTTLTGLSPLKLRYRLKFIPLIPPLILASFSLSGHTLNGFIVVLIVLAWGIWNIIGKAHWLNILLVCSVVSFGLLVSSTHYLRAYVETGSILGNAFKESAIVGTPLWTESLKLNAASLAEITGPIDHLLIILGQDQYKLSIIGLCSAFLAIILWGKFHQKKQTRSIPYIGTTVLALTLPFTGLLDSTTYKLSNAFIFNFRYALHWYPFTAVCTAMLVGYWYDKFTSSTHRYFKTLAILALISLTSLVSFLAYKTIMSDWRIPDWNEQWVSETLHPIKIAMQHIPTQKLLLEDARYNYYLDNHAILMYTRPTWDIIQARNNAEVQEALSKLKIGAVALDESQIRGWWDQIPLFDFLSNPNQAIMVERNETLRVYIIDETLAQQHQPKREQARIYLAEAQKYLQQQRLQKALDTYYQAELLDAAVFDELTQEEQQLVNSNRDSYQGYLAQARAHYQEGQFRKSLTAFQQAVQRNPWVLLDLTPERQAFLIEKMATKEQELVTPSSYQNYLAQARARYQEGQFRKSLTDFEQAVQLNPWVLLEMTLDEQAFLKEIQLAPYTIYLIEARTYYQQGKMEQSLETYLKAMALYPDTVKELSAEEQAFLKKAQATPSWDKTYWAYLAEARSLYLQGRIEESWETFQKAEALYPEVASELIPEEQQLIAQAREYFEEQNRQASGSLWEKVLDWIGEFLNGG